MTLLLQVISAFLSQGDEMEENLLAGSAPQANAYEFQSQVSRISSCDPAGDGVSVRIEVHV